MKPFFFAPLLLGLCIAPAAGAIEGTALEIAFKDRNERPGRVLIQDGRARGESERSRYSYVLADLTMPSLVFVDLGERTRTDASRVLFNGQPERYRLESRGTAEAVAGRPTREYAVYDDNGQLCSRLFVWSEPLEPELEALRGWLGRIRVDPKAVLPALGRLADGLLSPCARAEMDAMAELSRHGLLIKRINADDITAFTVTEVRTVAHLENCRMEAPARFENLPPPELVKRMLYRALFGGRPEPDPRLLERCP